MKYLQCEHTYFFIAIYIDIQDVVLKVKGDHSLIYHQFMTRNRQQSFDDIIDCYSTISMGNSEIEKSERTIDLLFITPVKKDIISICFYL